MDLVLKVDYVFAVIFLSLKEIHDHMDGTNSLVAQARRRVTLLVRSGSWKIYLYLFLFCFFVFLVIYFVIIR